MKILPLYHHFLEQTNVTFGVGAWRIDRSHGIREKQRKRGKGLRGTRNGGKKDPMGNGSNNLSGPDCRFEARRGDRTPFPTVNLIHRLVCPQWWCRIINKRLPRAGYLLCRFVIRCASHLCTYNGLTNRFSWKREREKKINKKERKKEKKINKKERKKRWEKSKLRVNMASCIFIKFIEFFPFFRWYFHGYGFTWFNFMFIVSMNTSFRFVRCLLFRFGLWVVNRGRTTIGLVSCRGYGFDATRILSVWDGAEVW